MVAIVVVAGVFCPGILPTKISATEASSLPEVIKLPINWNSTLLGSLVGRGTICCLRSEPVELTAFHSPGVNRLSPIRMRKPLPIKPDCNVDRCPESSNWLIKVFTDSLIGPRRTPKPIS